MSTIGDSLTVLGRLACKFFDCPPEALDDAAIKGTAQLAATKLIHQHRPQYNQPNTTATAVTIALFTARFAGTLAEFWAQSIAKCTGDATMTFDLRKNGATVLSGNLVLDSANTNRVAETAALNPAAVNYVAGDAFELVITVNAGTGALGTGISAGAVFNEHSQ